MAALVAPADRVVDVDSTLLLAADSRFLRAHSGDRDPEANDAFILVADRYTSGCELSYPIPKQGAPKPTPILGLWLDDGAKRPVLGEWTALGMDEQLPSLRDLFTSLLSHRGDDVAAWLRYQFGDAVLIEVFLGGGNPYEKLEAMLPYVQTWRRDTAFTQFSGSALPGFATRPPALRDPVLFAVAFAFWAFVKGRLYGHEPPPGSEYHTHWLRTTAQPDGQIASSREASTVVLAPYGTLLDATLPQHLDATMLKDILAGLRTNARSVEGRAFFSWVANFDDAAKYVEAHGAVRTFLADSLAGVHLHADERLMDQVTTDALREWGVTRAPLQHARAAYHFVRLIAKRSWIKDAVADYVTHVWRPALGSA
jgi:hypothetical protein